MPVDKTSPKIIKVSAPSEKDLRKFPLERIAIWKLAHESNKKFAKQTTEYFIRKSKYSTYDIGLVHIRDGGSEKWAQKKRNFFVGQVKKVGKRTDKYKVRFRDLNSQTTDRWFSVQNMADFPKNDKTKNKQPKVKINGNDS